MKTGSRYIVWIVTAAAVLQLLSCASPPTKKAFIPMLRTRLLKPDIIEEEHSYPYGKTRQLFKWQTRKAEWNVIPALKTPSAHAAFSFKKPFDFSENRDNTVLIFVLSPVSIDEQISITLVDGKNTALAGFLNKPLSHQRLSIWKIWGSYRMRMGDAGTEGVILHAEEGTPAEAVFDWSDIKEIRLTVLKPLKSSVTIRLQDMVFEPDVWGGK